MTGIDYPTISVGAHENLVVRLSLAAQLLMRRRGIDPAQMAQEMSPTKTVPNPNMRTQTDAPTVQIGNPGAVQNIVTVFSCMVAENFIDRSKPTQVDLSTAPTADYWATLIEDFSEVEKVVWSAVGKAVEVRRKKLAAVPPMEAVAS